jgi:hypothetical protein
VIFLPNAAWLSLVAQCLWFVDALLFLADSHQMNKYADARKLPTLRLGADGKVVTHWVEDADPAGQLRVRRSSRYIEVNRGGRRRSSVMSFDRPPQRHQKQQQQKKKKRSAPAWAAEVESVPPRLQTVVSGRLLDSSLPASSIQQS